MGSISLATSLFDSTGRWQQRVAVQWARMVLAICMVKVDVRGTENLDPTQHYVFCSNHLSLIDTPVMFGAMPREFRILARHNLWNIPFLGWHLRRAGHIPVRHENPRSAARNIAQATDKIAAGHSILVFPEGGRAYVSTMRHFKPGAAHIAIRAQVPIVPMALMHTRKILPPSSTHLSPGRAELRIGVPISTVELKTDAAPSLIHQVEQEVRRLASQE